MKIVPDLRYEHASRVDVFVDGMAASLYHYDDWRFGFDHIEGYLADDTGKAPGSFETVREAVRYWRLGGQMVDA